MKILKLRNALVPLIFAGLSFAELVIPQDQPLCRLYGMLQIFGTIAGILMAAYAGFKISSSHDLKDRNSAKMLIGEIIVGLVILWLAPLIVKTLVNSQGICGW